MQLRAIDQNKYCLLFIKDRIFNFDNISMHVRIFLHSIEVFTFHRDVIVLMISQSLLNKSTWQQTSLTHKLVKSRDNFCVIEGFFRKSNELENDVFNKLGT